MKRVSIILSLLVAAIITFAQSTVSIPSFQKYDAMLFSQQEVNGTARFVGVGGAMGALGGDATTIFYNPAGIGIYRSSEFTASLNVHWNNATMKDVSPSQCRTNANLGNVAYVAHWDIGASKGKEDGLIGINLGIAYNRMKNYNRAYTYSRIKNYSKTQFLADDAYGQPEECLNDQNFDNPDVGHRAILGYQTYLFNPVYNPTTGEMLPNYESIYKSSGATSVTDDVTVTENGGANEFALSVAGNISDIFYLGMSFICDYVTNNRYETYTEKMSSEAYTKLYNSTQLDATGFTYKIGFIVKPLSWLRIGGAYHTPTVYRARANYYSSAYSNINPDPSKGGNPEIWTPNISESCYFNAPMKAIGSLGFVLGKYGFIGVDYQWNNYSGIKLKNKSKFNVTNQTATREGLIDTHTIRAGLELKPIEALSLRLGGSYTTGCTDNDKATRYYYPNDVRTDTYFINDINSYSVSAGIGYRVGRHSFDLAYIWQVNNGYYSEFRPYNEGETSGLKIEPMTLRNVRNNITVSYSVRF
ncbi:MAG: hypothetical protein MJ010_06025 [Paludibacteraceae bacterium]|nr:hypothetical protein [Paludibacteraceae bacterium]